jgi:hypothetical protein
MKKLSINMKKQQIFLIACTFFSSTVLSRSIYRPADSHTPYIIVNTSDKKFTKKWTNQNSKNPYSLHSDYLQITPIFTTFNKELFDRWTMPKDEAISFRQDPKKSVQGKILSEQAEVVIEELRLKKKEFKHFTILKDRDFNYRTKSGLIVLKYKEYPFVLKILIEHPQTFVEPFSKSYEAGCMFVIGGSLRHLSGFTRIPNLHVTREILYQDKTYKALLDFPRKWFWSPKETAWLDIEWKHSLNKQSIKTSLPCIYGIICDLVIPHEEQPEKSLRRLSIEISNHLNFLIDPHEGNAIREKDTDKIVIIDTEHFPTMLGLKTKMYAKNYINWLMQLAFKYLETKFCRNKKSRSKCYDERYWDKSLSINSSFLSKT